MPEFTANPNTFKQQQEFGPASVLIVLRSLNRGGSQRQAFLLAREMQETYGIRVAIWTLEEGADLAEELAMAKIAWKYHPAPIRHRALGKIPGLLSLILAIRRWRPDTILSFNDLPNKICGAIWTWTGANSCVWNQRDEGREVTGHFLERRALKQVHIFTANSSQGADFLRERFGIPDNHIHIIPNGVQLAAPKRSRQQWREKLGVDGRALIATMVANLHHFKDHKTLFMAWAKVKENWAGDIHLVLAGSPGDTAEPLRDLRQRLGVEESIHFIGQTHDISGLLGASDISVFSSHLEGMPNAILESMAAGLPVVATRIPGSEDALGINYPMLVPPSDAHALAGALRELIENEFLRRRIGAQNQQRARNNFSVWQLGQRYMEIINTHLGFIRSHAE